MTERELLRVRAIEVKGLFKLYDHRIELKLDERVTVLHGANGVGKTVLLRFITALFAGDYSEFTRIPFESFSIQLTNNLTIHVKAFCDQKKSAKLEISSNNKSDEIFDIDQTQLTRWIENLPLSKVGFNRWFDELDGEELTISELWQKYEGARRSRSRVFRSIQEPKWLSEWRGQVKVHLIEAQRLLRLEPIIRNFPYNTQKLNMVSTVDNCAKELQLEISRKMAKYADQSQSLDQSFPTRLLQNKATSISIPELKQRMKEIEHKRAQLEKIGLIDKGLQHPFNPDDLDKLAENERGVMILYSQDTDQKLAVLDDLAKRIKLLLDKVNTKFKHKSIQIKRDAGFIAVGEGDNVLDLGSLSSGEQHELVLLYDLLFRVAPNTLVLIDEPELSLHLTWQKRFLPDLLEIIQVTNFDVLIATHSPFIVGDRSDLMVALDAEVA